MRRLYLVRHAVAEDPAEGVRFIDPLRPLTSKGRRRFRRIAQRLKELGDEVSAIYTSPALRAVQTAETLAAALEVDEVRVLDELRSDASPALLLSMLREMAQAGVAFVGHKRQLCELIALMTGAPPGEAARIRLRRGAILRIDVHKLRDGAEGTPRWWLRPATGVLRNGLPLEGSTPYKA